jgi:uncharacterized YccA/Bax inhibitor family protein
MIEIVQTTNPIFRRFPVSSPDDHTCDEAAKQMTFAGSIRKTTILAAWTGICAVWIWKALTQNPDPNTKSMFQCLLVFSALAPFGLVALSLWRKTLSPFTAPVYAMLQGVFFGFVCVALERRFEGLPMQVFCLTFAICIALANGYRIGFIRPSDPFRMKFLFSLLGVAFYFAAALLLPHVGIRIFPVILHGRGLEFSAFVIIIAAVTFVSAFDLAAKNAEQKYPLYMEWHAALGLSISLVWLYLEGLRIFIKNRVPNESQH